MRVENTASLARSSIDRGKNGTLFTVDTPTMGLLCCCPEVDVDPVSSARVAAAGRRDVVVFLTCWKQSTEDENAKSRQHIKAIADEVISEKTSASVACEACRNNQ